MQNKLQDELIKSLFKDFKMEATPHGIAIVKDLISHVKPKDHKEFYILMLEEDLYHPLKAIKKVSNTFLYRILKDIEESNKKAREKYIMLTTIEKYIHEIYANVVNNTNNLLKIKNRDGSKYFTEKEVSFVKSIGGLPITISEDEFIKSYVEFISSISNEVQIKAIEYDNTLRVEI